jgi:hypothetical protein
VEVGLGEGVEDYGVGGRVGVVVGEVGVGGEVQGADLECGLGGQVDAQISLGRRRGGMIRHRGLPVQTVDRAGFGGEVVTEHGVAAKLRLSGEHWHDGGAEDGSADLESAADAAEPR